MVTVTQEYINKHRTEAGSWTRQQLKALGVDWPPAKGWRQRVEGKELSEKEQLAFEAKTPAKSQRGKKLAKQIPHLATTELTELQRVIQTELRRRNNG